MVKSSTTSITPATHAARHRHGAEDPLTGDVRINALQFTTRNDVTGIRVADGTVYQNTSGKTMMVAVTIDLPFGNNPYRGHVLSDAATPPTDEVARFEISGGMTGTNVAIPVTFLVFDDDYYLVDASLDVNNGATGRWIEWT